MTEKKPVYNGYEERYLNGAELKETFENQYYCNGRHHSVILGITVPDYLELLGISDDAKYRIFINDYFCRVMREDNDNLICFFAHSLASRGELCKNLDEVQIEKVCPLCGSPMKFKSGKYGDFLGCSNYPKCKHTCNIPMIGKV